MKMVGIQSYRRGMVFGYKPHLTSITGDLMVPLTSNVTTTAANVPDNKMYVPLISSSSSSSSSSFVLSLPTLHKWWLISDMMLINYMDVVKVLGMDLVYPLLKDIKVLPKRDLSLYAFINRY
jgi:hypothetical protein